MGIWQGTIMDLQHSHGKIDHDGVDGHDYLIEEEEVALKHDETQAIVKLTDDGFVDIFAGPQLGIRLDPNTNSINLFGDSVNVIANNFNVRTKPYGFNWNGKAFNPALYTSTTQDVMTQARSKVRYSEGMIDIMKDLGLPVESVDKED